MTAAPIPRTHRVVACRGGDRIELEERAVPEPGAAEILLRLRVVGLCGTDLFKLDTGAVTCGQVLGHELVGEVVASGAGVRGFRRGDRIAVPHHVACGECHLCRQGAQTMCAMFRENLLEPGGFADHVLVRERALSLAAHKLPAGLADEAAVFLEPAACVLRGIDRSGLDAAGIAVVLGAGSMGLLHLLVLRARWPGLAVIMTDLAAHRCEMAIRLGAGACVGCAEQLREGVLEASAGRGADAVFDTIGGTQALEQGLELTRDGGTVVLFAHAPDTARAGFELNRLFKHERRIVGTYSGGLREQHEIFELLVGGGLDPSPLATHRLPLDEFDRGVELVRDRRALKVLFTPSVAATTR